MKKLYSYIRFSTPEQLKGDSLARQLKLAEDYATKHSLELVQMSDQGISAFRGKNLKQGKLGAFLAGVQSGEIPSGAVLLVESFDRLSRQGVSDAITTFMQLINSGIEVVTLSDGERHYTRESINSNPMDLMLSVMIMSRANEESETKSRRLKSAWVTKREKVGERKLTGLCPAWLRLVDGEFEVVEGRGQIIQRIYKEYLAGKGYQMIANELNDDGIEPWRKGRCWHRTYVKKILENESVVGVMQPHVMKSGKRTPIGDPIKDYFPAVVDQKSFNAVQYAKSKIDKSKSGRKSEGLLNLFSGLVKCGLDGLSMHYSTKQKDTAYFMCSGRHQGCKNPLYRYDEFQSTFFKFFHEVDLNSIFVESETVAKSKSLHGAIQAKQGEMLKLNESVSNITKAIELGANLETLVARLTSLEAEKEALTGEIEALQGELDQLDRGAVEKPDFEQYELDKLTPDQRLQINQELKRLIEKITVVSRKVKGRGKYQRKLVVTWQNGKRSIVLKDPNKPAPTIDLTNEELGDFVEGFTVEMANEILERKSRQTSRYDQV